MSREAITFLAWKSGPVVAAQQEGDAISPLVYGFRGDVYAVTGSTLAKGTKVEDITAALGFTPRRASENEARRLRGLVDAKEIRRLLNISETQKAAVPPVNAPVAGVPCDPDDIQAQAQAQAQREAEAQAEAEAKAAFRQFLSQYKYTTLTGRDPRCPPNALQHARATKAKVLFVVEMQDRRRQTALVIAASPGLFWPAVPDRESGKSAAARNRWAAEVLTTGFSAFQVQQGA